MRSVSPEIQNKSPQISALQSTAISRNASPSGISSVKLSTRGPSPPSTKLSTRGPSPPSTRLSTQGPSPSMHDPQGSSRITGGHFRGRAAGAAFRFADAGKLICVC